MTYFTKETIQTIEKLTGKNLDSIIPNLKDYKPSKITGKIHINLCEFNKISQMLNESNITWEDIDEEISKNLNKEICIKVGLLWEKMVLIKDVEKIAENKEYIHMPITQRLANEYLKRVATQEKMKDDAKVSDLMMCTFNGNIPTFICRHRNGRYFADLLTEYNKDKEYGCYLKNVE
ncbi:hypothetical protein [Moraxella bovis]|uniref:hypothetical protein n=1 Tax=Moraxella bovis TaxID=476 RepID=UPI0022276758|nr:hypothetical protein [Moraxella bovis]UYZ91014.1 hypothetical protein LP103_07265 [Moraxella bovis]UYZ91027.1 hypothetical protein LP103_07330 [Moraxella bovis]